MRITVVNHHPDHVVGGSELQCDLVAAGLRARGHDVTFLAVRPSPDVPSIAATAHPYAVVEVAHDPRTILAGVLEQRPDVVYWRFNRRGLRTVVDGLRRAGIPLVFAIAHVDDVTRWPSWPAPARGASLRDRGADLRARVRHRAAYRALRGTAAIASQRQDLLLRIPADRVALQRHVPNAMAPAEVPFSWPRPFVAWVGSLKPRKRPELIPDIAHALAASGVDVLVAGSGVAPDSRAPESHAPDTVHHLGTLSTPEVVGMLRAARCLTVTSRPEGFSNVMIQAWWTGTPTVSLEYDPDGVIVAEGLGAVAGGDVATFLADVVRLAGDEPAADRLRSEAGARAARFAQENFAPDAVLDRLEALLVEVVAQ